MTRFGLFLFFACSIGQLKAQISHEGQPLWRDQSPASLTIPEPDLEALQREDAVTDLHKEVPWRFGVEHSVRWNPSHAGSWTREQGHKVWRLGIQAPGATGLSIRFATFHVPKGGKLFIIDTQHGNFIGALDHRNMKDWGGLATGLLATDEIIVEYHQPEDLDANPILEIDQVVRGYRALSGWPFQDRGPFGNSGACNVNVNCPEGAAWATEKRAVALIVQGGFSVCTGALVNNTANDGTPYFLTANHCLGNPTMWVYYFNHEAANCVGNNGPTNQSISGGTLLTNSNQSDFALIELSESPPANFNVQYAGWDASGEIPSNTVGIHHPSGDVKKICFDNDSPSQQQAAGAAVWYLDQWELGVTEGGSSGSPLFNQDHRIIGQLYGGFAACAGGSENNGEADWYGRFGASWDLGLSTYLDPLDLGVQVWDGYPDAPVTFDNDAGIQVPNPPLPTLCQADDMVLEVVVTNTGNNTLTSCMVEMTINGSPAIEQVWAGSLEPQEEAVLTLPPFSPAPGDNEILIEIVSPNGVSDDNPSNNLIVIEFEVFEGPTYAFTLDLTLDDYGSETTWSVYTFGQTFYEGGPYMDGLNGTQVTETFCLAEGCYNFKIQDSAGDGICCGFGSGSFELKDPNGQTIGAGADFGSSETIQFCADESLNLWEAHAEPLRIFPNPASDQFVIDCPSGDGQLQAVDAMGRTVQSFNIQARQTQMDVSAWANGVYLLVWQGANHTVSTRRVLVAH